MLNSEISSEHKSDNNLILQKREFKDARLAQGNLFYVTRGGYRLKFDVILVP